MVASLDGGYRAGQKVAGKYTLLTEIGSGGMGSVWLARNDTTEANVALKLWHAGEDEDAEQTKTRFRNEARLSAMLTHRNIVRVFDLVAEEPSGALVLVMERLQGCTLATYLRVRGFLTAHACVGVACGVLAALEQAHRAGIVHRDVKPANVFLAVDPDGHVTPKLLDFGIAKVPAASSSLTEDGRSLGTPRYMSPEQIRGKDIDGRSDVFSLAIIVYEMLTGVSPFAAETPGGALASVLEMQVEPDPRIAQPLFDEILRATKKRSAERHASATEFAASLRAVVPCTDAEIDESLRQLDPLALAEEPTPYVHGIERVDTGKRKQNVGLIFVGASAILAVAIAAGVVLKNRLTAAEHPIATSAARATTRAAGTAGPLAATNDIPTPPSLMPANSAALPLASPDAISIERPAPAPLPDRAPAKRSSPKKPIATTPGF